MLPAAIVLAPLAIGTVHPWPRAILFGLSGLGLALAIAVRHTQGRRIQLTVPMLILAVAAVATALQLIPLPETVLRWLSPRTAEVLEQTQRGGYGALPLSLDPPSTIRELSKIVGYLAFLAWATAYCVHAHRRRLVLVAVVVSATTVALLGFLQAALGARILFFYVPHSQILNEILVRGSFVNPNHFGSLMCLAAPCALTLVLRERDSRIPAILALIVINLAVILSLSRSAMVTAPLAQVVTLLLARAQTRGSSSGTFRTESSLVAIGTITATLVIALAIGGSRVTSPFSATRTEGFGETSSNPNSKFFAWQGATDIAVAFPWTGAGRGAFGQGFALLNERPGYLRYEWVENAYLQPVADWGVPIALLLLVLAGWAGRTFLRRAMLEPLSIGAAGALFGLAIHDIADFSIEIPGVAIPALALAATLFARQGKEVGPDLGWFVSPRLVWLAVPLLAIALPVAAVWTSDANQDGRQLARLSRDPTATPAEVIARGSALLRIHPADAHIAALVAQRLAKDSHPEAMKWLNDALFLDRTNSTLHVIAAEVLARAGRKSQALLEYRTAMDYGALPSEIWTRISARYVDRDALVKAAGDSPERLYDLANWLFGHRRVVDADLICDAMLMKDRFSLPASRLHVRTAVAMGDVDKVRARVASLLSMDRATETRYTAVRGLIFVGDLDAAGNLLDTTPDRSTTASELELELAQAMARAKRLDSARARLDKMPALTSRAARARWHEVRATIERLAGNQHQSAWEHEQALRLQSSTP
jgi:Tfp pilus assembly protein PilF